MDDIGARLAHRRKARRRGTPQLAHRQGISWPQGPVLTPGFEDYLERASAEQAKRLCQLVPLGRIGRPEESAPLAVYLASDEHSVIGQQGFLRKAVRSWSDTCRDHALSRAAPMGSVGCGPKLPVRGAGTVMR
jgi:hypothetical protein